MPYVRQMHRQLEDAKKKERQKEGRKRRKSGWKVSSTRRVTGEASPT